MTSESFAIALTVKDECEMLRCVLPYYRAQGAERIYLFFDGTSDEARTAVAGLDYVEARDCVDPGALPRLPKWVQLLDPPNHMDHRKRINTLFAAEQARLRGIGWLAALDPDEIVQADPGQAGLGAFLAAVPEGVDQVLLPNLELLPLRMAGSDAAKSVFITQRLFLRRQDKTRFLWRIINRLLRSWVPPNRVAQLENRLYRLLNRGLFPPVLQNPLTGTPIYPGLYTGYTNGKAFIRTAVVQNHNFNIHKWQAVDGPLRSITRGRLLHYDLPSAASFLHKFRQRPANMQIRIFDTRFQLGEIAREAPREMAQAFFDGSLCVPDTASAERLVKAGIAIWVDDVAQSFETGKVRSL